MKITEVEIGTKLELELINDIGDVVKPSFVSEFELAENEEIIYIAAPIHEGTLYPVHLGTYINLYFMRKDDLYKFRGKVIGRYSKEVVAQLKVEKVSEIEKIQRRQFYRFECYIPIRYRFISVENKNDLIEKMEFSEAITQDISGSGICLLLEETIEKDTLIECEVDVGTKVKFIGKVLRASRYELSTKYNYEVGIVYIKIENSDREKIIKFIFNEQRKLRKKGLI